MKEKFGQWWLDIAKYVVTSVIIASLLGDWEEKAYLFLTASAVVVITLSIGIYFLRQSEKENQKKGKKR